MNFSDKLITFYQFRLLKATPTEGFTPGRCKLVDQVSGERPNENQHLALQVGGWAWCQRLHSVKSYYVTETATSISTTEPTVGLH